MNFICFIIITFFCIAGSTSAYEAFEDNLASIRAEVRAYCLSPDEYENSEGGQKYGPIEKWNVSAVTSMAHVFYNTNCNPDISNWDVSAVKEFKYMFTRAVAFNQDLTSWDVGNGQIFEGMFYDAPAFNHNLSTWNVTNGQNFVSARRI